jgi:energy-coupling factor transport system substrate-specific component
MRRLLAGLIYALSGALGIFAFLAPFFLPNVIDGVQGQSQVAPLLTAALVGLSVLALVVEVQGQSLSAKTVALLGVLVAVTSVLRFVDIAIPLPGGFSPIFVPIILAGYVFGARFGFLMGALTLLISSMITGGVGPWLPYQMFAAGWTGLTTGWLPRPKKSWASIAMLCAFGFLWGLLYGVIINLYFWPLAQGPIEQSWAQGLSLRDTLTHYATFYVVTSLGWDLIRAVWNAVLLLVLTAPVVKVLTRFQRRFHFEVTHG